MPHFPTTAPITVTVELVGDVRITASDREDTVVEVRPGDPTKASDVKAAEGTTVEMTAGHLVIKAPRSWRRFTPFGGHEMVEVAIELPTGSQVTVDSDFGGIIANGELGTCRITTGMGDVRLDVTGALAARSGFGSVSVERVQGDAELSTGSGGIRAEVVEGTVRIKNSNGSTTVGEVGGDLRVKAANGDIVVRRACGSAVAKTACGDVRVLEVERGTVVAETSAGEVEVGVRPGTAAWIDAATRFGRVRNALDQGSEPGPTDERAEVRLRTSAGDILISRAATQEAAPALEANRTR